MSHSIRSYFLLFLFLFGTLVPGQTQEELTRLPFVWQHYQLHKSLHPTVSFIDYLQQHYGKDFVQHRSAHDHSSLPMKSGDNHLHAPVPIDLPKQMEVVVQATCFDSQPIFYKDQPAPQSFLHDIWQPPRHS